MKEKRGAVLCWGSWIWLLSDAEEPKSKLGSKMILQKRILKNRKRGILQLLKIANKTIELECNNCGNVLQITPSELNFTEEIFDPDRQMGPEYEYDFTGEFLCPKCSNEMQVSIRAFEYPEGAYNSQDEETDGCSIIGGVGIDVVAEID